MGRPQAPHDRHRDIVQCGSRMPLTDRLPDGDFWLAGHGSDMAMEGASSMPEAREVLARLDDMVQTGRSSWPASGLSDTYLKASCATNMSFGRSWARK